MSELGFSTRPMTQTDVEAVLNLEEASSDDLKSRLKIQSEAVPADGHHDREVQILARLVGDNGPGCWVAEVSDGSLIGMSVGTYRDSFFGLSGLFVRPDAQASGVGRELLRLALSYGADAQVGMIMSSPDFRAIRSYAMAGFRLHPAVQVEGRVDRSALPVVSGTRDGDLGDVEFADAVDRAVTGKSRAPDVEFLLRMGARMVVAERASSRGFALFRDGAPPVDGLPILLGATDDATAQQLLWRVLGEASQSVLSWAWTRQQSWAIDVAHAARLHVTPSGPLFVRGIAEPFGPWLPNAYFY